MAAMITHAPARNLLWAILAIGVGLFAVACISGLKSGIWYYPALMGPMFLVFGVFKGALGWDALHHLRHGGEDRDRYVASHGSEQDVRHWAIYKLIAMLISVVAAVLCLVVTLSQ